MAKFDDLTGKEFNSWKVLEYAGNRYWKCICTDCNKTIRNVHSSSLKQGTSKSCGCKNRNNVRDDISGKEFGNWKVLYNIGDGYWMCECQCENHTTKPVKRCNLVSGKSKSCGCLKEQLMRNTFLNRYGDVTANKINKPRKEWQINTLNDRRRLKEFILTEFEVKPTFKQIADRLGVTRHTISRKIHEFELEVYIDIDPLSSVNEIELREFVSRLVKTEVICNSRDIISPYELDIYIPEKKIALEFNGSYWHSDVNVNKYYHQHKTLMCAEKNIRLIHIFEYEWELNKQGVINYLADVFSDNKQVIYGGDTTIKEVSNEEAKDFLDKNHLQGYTYSEINIALLYENSIVGILTIGKPRLDNEYQYEITRTCFKSSRLVLGGLEKIFNYFVDTYRPESVVTYINLAKFTGNSYLKLGFVAAKKSITEPNYVWYDTSSKVILPRYKTTKQKLVEVGLGTEDQTEDEIMKNLDFLKIYDSGNLKLVWRKH